MNGLKKNITNKCIEAIPLSIYRKVIRRSLLGINYHVVSNEHLPHIRHVLPYKTENMFENDLKYLKQNYDVVPYDKAFEVDEYPRRKYRGNSLILTFDDGYSECFSVARPLLKKHDISCLFFVITDAIDNEFLPYPNKVSLCIEKLQSLENNDIPDAIAQICEKLKQSFTTLTAAADWLKSLHIADTGVIDQVCEILNVDCEAFLKKQKPFMTKNEIIQMVADGFTVGGHTKRHAYLYTLNDEEKIEEEIVESCRTIKEITGQEYVPFAFPFSADNLDRDFLHRLVKKYDFIGLMFDMRELRLDRNFMIHRIWGDNPEQVSDTISNMKYLLEQTYQNFIKYKYGTL